MDQTFGGWVKANIGPVRNAFESELSEWNVQVKCFARLSWKVRDVNVKTN